MRIFDSTFSAISASRPTSTERPSHRERNSNIKEKRRTLKKSKPVRPSLEADQIRAKLEAFRNKNMTNMDGKFEKTKETSTFMSENNASKVTLTSVNKNSQKLEIASKQENERPKPAANASEEMVQSSQVEAEEKVVKPGGLLNDPSDPHTVKKLKNALTSGMLKLDPKTKSVLDEIIASKN